MKKLKKRRWMARIWRLPHAAGETASKLIDLAPPRFRLFVICAFLVIPTTVLISRFPLSVVPEYKAGDIAVQDVIIPIQLQSVRAPVAARAVKDDVHRQHILLRAGDVVTEELVPLVGAVRRHQLAERSPRRFFYLLLAVSLIYFALYKAATTSQSSRLEPLYSFWVVGTAVFFQAALVRIGLFTAAVLSGRPESIWFGDAFIFQFAIPFAASSLVTSLLVGSQMGLIAGFAGALLTGFVSPFGIETAGFALASSVTAVYGVQRYCSRNAVGRVSIAILIVNFLMGLLVVFGSEHGLTWRDAINIAVAGAVGSLLTAGVASFGTPIYESAFGILTDIKLLELSNADHPLLRRLAIETPGTNHHSFVVGTLAEAAAKQIGANALLARVGCLFHDIGKLAAPKMYIENQQGAANPHDKVSPKDSVRIITGHVRKGLQLAHEANLPQQIIDFIPQHHGTRVLAYFFHKAKAQAEKRGEMVRIEDFRYPGPRPQTREAVILMMSDGSEAAVRSLEEPSPDNISAIVRKIVDAVIADGQLDECNITFREITLIRESLISTLVGMYHHRISYPGFNPPSEGDTHDEAQSESLEPVGVPSRTTQARAHSRR
jgi:putative nucleotidyltransferase with HDIG domain